MQGIQLFDFFLRHWMELTSTKSAPSLAMCPSEVESSLA